MKWKYKNEDFKSLSFDFVNGSLRKSKCVKKELPYMPGCFAYLETTPEEQLEKDWEEIKPFNEIGPSVND